MAYKKAILMALLLAAAAAFACDIPSEIRIVVVGCPARDSIPAPADDSTAVRCEVPDSITGALP